MRSTRGLAFVLVSLSSPTCALGCGSSGAPSTTSPPADAAPEVSPEEFVRTLPSSCAFDCAKGCPDEDRGPFACPAMGPWSTLPHQPSCGATEPAAPAPIVGACTATEPTGEALRKAGPIDGVPGAFVLPDGHRLTPAGRDLLLADPAHVGGFPVALAAVPSTHYAIVVEAGFGDHLVRSVDLTALAAGSANAIVATVVVPRASWGLVVRAGDAAGSHRALVSGGALGKVWSLQLDDATGALTLQDGRSIDLGTMTAADGTVAPFFAAGIAASPDGKRLVAASAGTPDVRIVSLEVADWGKEKARVSLGRNEHFGVAFDPADAAGTTAYVAMWGDAKVVAIDVAAGAVKQTFAVGKDPEGMAFLDARWMVVAAADGDTLTLVDRVAGAAVATVPIAPDSTGKPGPRGWSPTALTYDPAGHRLWVAEAVVNAVEAFDVDLSGAAPALTSKGRLPTAWWPTDLALERSSGSPRLLVLDGRGHGTGSGTGAHFGPGDGEIAESMHGSVQSIDLGALDLAATSKQVAADAALRDVGGYPTVTCPPGVDDFPVPTTNDRRSTQIQHVFLVIRENKNFDGVLGDLPDVDGEPKDVLSPGNMDALWTNFRAIGKTWTIADGYYTDAEYSSQGHVWTTYGRTTDFTERVWMIGAAGKGRTLGGGVTDVGRAEEGSIFQWLLGQGVEFDILGEATGLPAPPGGGKRNPLDANYPGLAQNVGLEDTTKSCYFAARARALCDLHDFVYLTLPNDHTFGGNGGRPTPETMIAVNDEATGVVLDALSHSPAWPSSLVIVTEDDPQDGADHVDLHRTPIVFAGPWIKKGYVAHGHYDVASLIKLLAHLRGLPYPNDVVARAPLPLEMFTSTPDFAPYTFAPRTWPRACNAKSTAFAAEAAQWTDWDEVDEQVGLGVHVRTMLRATPAARGPLLPKMPSDERAP